jgi:hypothetical protein
MATEGLQIKIGADVQSAVTSLNTLNASLNKTTQTAANVGATGMNELTKGTKQANFALVNFSRVASDAPFGLIGIANNIDPLIQSFVSLRKETGSGKAALSALASSLAGGGGLILGISLLTSVLQFAELGFSRWGASAKSAKDKTKELNDETKSSIVYGNQLIFSLKDVSSELAKEASTVTVLVKTLKDETSTRGERNNAIKELNKIAPELFNNLSAEKIEIDKLNDAYKSYINTIQAKVRLQILETQLTDILRKELFLTDKNNASLKFRTALENDLLEKSRKAGELNIAFQERTKNLVTVENELFAIQKQKENVLNRIIEEQNKLNKAVVTNSKTETSANNKAKNNIDEIGDLLKNYNEQLKGINWDEQNRGIEGNKKRLELAGETLKTLYLKGVKETSDAWIKVKNDFDNFQREYDKFVSDKRLKEINNDVANYVSNIGSYSENVLGKSQTNTIKALQAAGKAFILNSKSQEKYLDELNKKNLELANTITGFLSPALEGVFESLVKGEDPFEALKNSVQQLIIQLGKAVIQSLILKAVTSAIGGPATGAASGLGLNFIRGDQLRSFTFGR